jgi:uncharacterized protein YecE (DUF72 family)
MKFGKVPLPDLDRVDFSLPPEPAANKAVLAGGKPSPIEPLIYLGCAQWGWKEWVGKLYPEGTREKGFLEQYIHQFNAIELNATHYKIYSPGDIQKWADRVDSRPFRFCPKIPQRISHYSNFTGVDDITTRFLEGVLAFGDHLGPLFIQLSERYGPNRKDPLFEYLNSLPTDLPFFLEVRHPDWFKNGESFDRLRNLKIGAVITDTAGSRECAHMHLTIPKAFVRFVGNGMHPTDFPRIDAWVERIRYWLDNGLEELYFFVHNQTLSPELTVYLVDKLNEACGLQLTKPRFISSQRSLF